MSETIPDVPEGLRARILEALNTAPAAFVRDVPETFADPDMVAWRRHDAHRYDATCALCRGEAETLADAVLAAVQPEPQESGQLIQRTPPEWCAQYGIPWDNPALPGWDKPFTLPEFWAALPPFVRQALGGDGCERIRLEAKDATARRFDRLLCEHGGLVQAVLAGVEDTLVPEELQALWVTVTQAVAYVDHLSTDVERFLGPLRRRWEAEAAAPAAAGDGGAR